MDRIARRRSLLLSALTALLLLALAAGSQFVAATYGAGGVQPPPVTPDALSGADRARVRLVQERIPVVRLSGSWREIGRQHGRLLRPQIDYLYREYFEALAVPAVGRDALTKWAKECEPFLPDHVREELHGLAEGLDATYERALLVNCMVDRLQTVFCSTVAVAGTAAVDGEVYLGRNLDFPGRNILHRMTVVFRIEPDEGPALVTVGWPGIVGMLSGMNEHGVAGATMMIHRGEELRPGLPYMIMYREALLGARTAADVHGLIAKCARTCPNNFMVVDGQGRSEVIEYDQEKVVRRGTDDEAICSTNCFVSDEMQDRAWSLGTARYGKLERFLAERRGSIDLDAVIAALRDVATPWFMNVQSMVFLPARRELELSVGGKLPAADQPFVRLDRAMLFGDWDAGG